MNVSVSPKGAAVRADVTAAVVEATQRIRFDDIPARTIATAKRVLLDTLAVAWAAADAAGVNAARALALRGAPGHASLWGEGETRREPSAAAFYNGTLAAALDFDSLAGFVHADIIVAPAALAVAEQQRRNGRELLAALTLGNELVVRLAAATRTNRGFFHTSIAGVFGAALAAARLRGLDADRTHNALGIALCHAGGTQQSHVEQRLTKRLQSAFAARDGIISADLAALGTTGPRAAFEGPFGLFALFEEGRPEEVLDGLGRRFLAEETALKRFPACGCSHAALAAALEIVAHHGIAGADVARGEIVLTPYMARLVGGAFAPEANPQVTGQFNVRYGVAAVLARGGFGLADIEPARRCSTPLSGRWWSACPCGWTRAAPAPSLRRTSPSRPTTAAASPIAWKPCPAAPRRRGARTRSTPSWLPRSATAATRCRPHASRRWCSASTAWRGWMIVPPSSTRCCEWRPFSSHFARGLHGA
ncbi:MmgE/PrpD family protein [Xanthobacter aminoxidans]|uniref:MmgE/PrpD family protein n=1 Tax=Xanthobacter aminoxidans TaxID=186280 RepID=A0ABW6ZGA1_9HYPH